MPLARYFLYVGGTLLALLLALNAYVASPVVANTPTSEADIGRPVVRIHSAQKLPERIVIDTSIPTIVPAPPAVAEAVEAPAKRPALDAMAQVAAPELTKPAAKKPEPKAPPKRKIARRQLHQPMMAYAQAPRFDFDFFSHN
jgi:hypothetical protein